MAGLLLVAGLVVAGAAGGEAVLCYRCHQVRCLLDNNNRSLHFLWPNFTSLYVYFVLQDDCEGFLPSRAATVDCAESCLVTRSAFQGVMVEGRGCGAGRGRDSCHTRQLGGGARATVCSCNTDRCNIAVTRISGLSWC